VYFAAERWCTFVGISNLKKNKIEQVSLKQDNAGYDIVSYELNGEKKYIEVKSTTQENPCFISIYLSEKERLIASTLKNYYFYIVYDITSENPKIWKIKDPLGSDNLGKIRLEPVSYKLNLKGKNIH